MRESSSRRQHSGAYKQHGNKSSHHFRELGPNTWYQCTSIVPHATGPCWPPCPTTCWMLAVVRSKLSSVVVVAINLIIYFIMGNPIDRLNTLRHKRHQDIKSCVSRKICHQRQAYTRTSINTSIDSHHRDISSIGLTSIV